MRIMADAQDSLNAQYGASVFTDFAFNGLGILDKVTAVHCTIPGVEGAHGNADAAMADIDAKVDEFVSL